MEHKTLGSKRIIASNKKPEDYVSTIEKPSDQRGAFTGTRFVDEEVTVR
ncbi:hypothetical protein QUF79_03425 [Fictibacillus enclensis]|nr:hypothetical protein [Fictibacillus enclensis]MDM5197083.1 hypothetical protein [Fictibacillus enclensis]